MSQESEPSPEEVADVVCGAVAVANCYLARALGAPPGSELKEEDFELRGEFLLACGLAWGDFLVSEHLRGWRPSLNWFLGLAENEE
jgi:hypothetical protein